MLQKFPNGALRNFAIRELPRYENSMVWMVPNRPSAHKNANVTTGLRGKETCELAMQIARETG